MNPTLPTILNQHHTIPSLPHTTHSQHHTNPSLPHTTPSLPIAHLTTTRDQITLSFLLPHLYYYLMSASVFSAHCTS